MTDDPATTFGRMLTAMVTPFHPDGSLDLESAQRLATHLVDTGGHDGLVVSGTTGESPTTTDEEKERLIRAVVEAVGDRARVVAGVGTNDTAHTLHLAHSAEKAGAHALLVVTPYYSKPPQAGLVRHFTAVADATALPVMLYDIPGRSGVPIERDTLARLAEHPRIRAVKDAKGDLMAIEELCHTTNLAFYSGEDAINLAMLAVGAVGLVSVVGHVAGVEYARLIAEVERGDLVAARLISRQLVPAVRGIMTRTQGAIMVKAALELTGVLPTRTVRSPLVEATDDQVARLRSDLADAGLAGAAA